MSTPSVLFTSSRRNDSLGTDWFTLRLVDSLDRDFADFSYLVQARSNEVAEANAAEEEERWQWSQAGAAASAKNGKTGLMWKFIHVKRLAGC